MPGSAPGASSTPSRGGLTVEFCQGAPVADPALTVQRDSAWLTRSMAARLRTAVADAMAGVGPFDLAMAVGPFGLASGGVDPATPVPYAHQIGSCGGVSLDPYQIEAVRVAVARRVSFLVGVPGSGKTTRTLAKLVAWLVAQGETLLCVTPSNVAADVVLEALAAELGSHTDWTMGLVRRVGQHASSVLTPAVRAHVMPDEQERATGALPPTCRVVVTTTAQLHLADGIWRRFDSVVVDEASQVVSPAVALAAGLARHRVVIAGDPCQLPPVVVSETPRADAFLRRDVFRMSGADERAFDPSATDVVLLRQQHRYPAELARFIGDLAYRGQIVTAPRTGRRTSPVPLLFVDTSETEAAVGGDHRRNGVHAELVAWIAAHLGASAAARSGVLTLYRDQVAAINAALRGAALRVGSVSTVHRAQGQTHAHSTIVDLADAPGRDLPFLGGTEAATAATALRLLTVACSRPREAVWIVGHAEWLRRQGNTAVQRLLDLVAEHGVLVSAEELAASDPAIALTAGTGVAMGAHHRRPGAYPDVPPSAGVPRTARSQRGRG